MPKLILIIGFAALIFASIASSRSLHIPFTSSSKSKYSKILTLSGGSDDSKVSQFPFKKLLPLMMFTGRKSAQY